MLPWRPGSPSTSCPACAAGYETGPLWRTAAHDDEPPSAEHRDLAQLEPGTGIEPVPTGYKSVALPTELTRRLPSVPG